MAWVKLAGRVLKFGIESRETRLGKVSTRRARETTLTCSGWEVTLGAFYISKSPCPHEDVRGGAGSNPYASLQRPLGTGLVGI